MDVITTSIKQETEDMDSFVNTIKIEQDDLENAIAEIKTENDTEGIIIYNEDIKTETPSPITTESAPEFVNGEVGCDSFINSNGEELIKKAKRKSKDKTQKISEKPIKVKVIREIKIIKDSTKTKGNSQKCAVKKVKVIKQKTKSKVKENVSLVKKKAPSEKTLHKCTECHFSAKNRADLTLHMRLHTGETPYHCNFCIYKGKRRSSLILHLKVHKIERERPFNCVVCGKFFATKRNLKDHSLIHTNEKPFECYDCGFRSNYKGSIRHHIRLKHSEDETLPKVQSCICFICGKYLSRVSALTGHLRTHTGEKPHECELCGRSFREKDALKMHVLTHTKEKPFQCEECDYRTNRKAMLQDHMKSHVKYHTLVNCEECGKRYSTKLLLKHHMNEQHLTDEFTI